MYKYIFLPLEGSLKVVEVNNNELGGVKNQDKIYFLSFMIKEDFIDFYSFCSYLELKKSSKRQGQKYQWSR